MYLKHYGVKGMKWGVRRYQNYDGTRIKDPKKGDVKIKKGHRFQRLYNETDSFNKDDYRSKRLYVSDSAYDYLSDDFFINFDKPMVQILESKKDLVFAGEDSINKILNDIGEKPLSDPGDYKNESQKTDRDFLMLDKEIGEKFIKRALEKGYDGVRDPVDDLQLSDSAREWYEKETIGGVSAKVLFNLDDKNYIKTKHKA